LAKISPTRKSQLRSPVLERVTELMDRHEIEEWLQIKHGAVV